jgi:hypothetical protein
MAIPILSDIFGAVKDVVSEVVVDKDKRDQVNLELARLEDQAQARLDAQVQGQIEVNKVEAASGSVFVAGWRPAIGWVGALALLFAFVLSPILQWTAQLLGSSVVMPSFEFDQLITVIMAMLGIGGMRTLEKIKGVSTNDYNDVPGRVVPASTEVNVKPTGEISITKEATQATIAQVAPKKSKKFKLF